MKIKVNNKMLDRFLQIMNDYGEFVFGDEDYLKGQLELCLNSQGYWSGCSIKVFYNKELKDFVVEQKY